ncbi:flagellar basal body P-ring formation chaperone FlgA [Methyloversatilis thermotolerans]|uniref:flagellar basal body P-ring formation chaperone FlgA n=1 Tax=Methyloversatilis thermotolerans TaxID=1346290 RepID=UPI000367C164|nr:flagellar basal body P-ring formation chaperone FlgA [Methyloversatilis thermotolerans]
MTGIAGKACRIEHGRARANVGANTVRFTGDGTEEGGREVHGLFLSYPGMLRAQHVFESVIHQEMITMLRIFLSMFLSMLCLFASASAVGQNVQDPVRSAVQQLLAQQTAGLPGQISIEIGQADPRLALGACKQMDAFLPSGARAWGRINVGVRCLSGSSWTIFVPARVRVEGEYLVAARALGRGQVVGEGDIAPMRGDLTELPPNMIIDARQALGLSVNVAMAAGQPLRADWLKAPVAVQSGQIVKLLARGTGFSISHDGRALAAAQPGQTVQVRTGGGQVVSGVARAGGIVEVVY